MKKKIGDKTQFFQPLQRPILNWWSYFWYCLCKAPVWKIVVVVGSFVVATSGFITDFMDIVSEDRTWLQIAVVMFGYILPLFFVTVPGFIRTYNRRFTTKSDIEGIYDNVMPPDDSWKRADLIISGKKEPVFTSDAVDEYLRGSGAISMTRDKEYEKRLKKYLKDHDRWNSTYQPFLRDKHREAMYKGQQFNNEKKFGISTDVNISQCPVNVNVHKTCYFDTYLTNIIPGTRLKFNYSGFDDIEMTKKVAGDLYLPYMEDSKSGEGHLLKLDQVRTANELGITTLCIFPSNKIRLWVQGEAAQCSRGLLVATGSGSADWEDCRKFLGDDNGFRKAVIYGMNRELWEESDGERNFSKKAFINNVDTRITGYFRWLTKGGKSEFVGLSRIALSNIESLIFPEKSEVEASDAFLSADTIKTLKKSINGYVKTEDAGKTYDSECSVSCTMAIIALERLCDQYCSSKCLGYDRANKCCGKDSCSAVPREVFFEQTV